MEIGKVVTVVTLRTMLILVTLVTVVTVVKVITVGAIVTVVEKRGMPSYNHITAICGGLAAKSIYIVSCIKSPLTSQPFLYIQNI